MVSMDITVGPVGWVEGTAGKAGAVPRRRGRKWLMHGDSRGGGRSYRPHFYAEPGALHALVAHPGQTARDPSRRGSCGRGRPVAYPCTLPNVPMPVSDLLAALLLGIIEGLTEFLPVSSTGHLLIAQPWLGPRSDFFNIVIQAGAILAITLVFRQRIVGLATGLDRPENRDYVIKLVAAFAVT